MGVGFGTTANQPALSLDDGHDPLADAALRWRWLRLTQVEMPALAEGRKWPVGADHCFQRILLDNACNGCWRDSIVRRPAWRHAPPATLRRALSLGEDAVAGRVDLNALNALSLGWRRRG